MSQTYFEMLYGVSARYSEHRCGEHITFHIERQVLTGTILWVSAECTFFGGEVLPMRYIVKLDKQRDLFYLVWPSEVVEEELNPL